jgi:hypothetical protein
MIPPNRLVISSISTGLQTFDKPWLLNNDAFPNLDNALCWRKRLIKKPGSAQLGRLERSLGNTGASPFVGTVVPIQTVRGFASFRIGSAVLTDGNMAYAGPEPVPLISSDPGNYNGTYDHVTGVVTINHPAIVPTAVQYIPALPVMGIEEFEADKSASDQIDFHINVYFDTVYSYIFNGVIFTDNSFYKTTGLPVHWSGADYQQFDSTNYYRAMWVTNNNPGAQFVKIDGIAPGATTSFTVTAFNPVLPNGTTFTVFLNEFGGASATVVNGKTFTATVTSPTTFTIPAVTVALTGGAIQYLNVNSPDGFGDGIRWFDGQGPGATGFVNFSPPLDNLASASTTYLIGCRIIIPFGNRLLAIGTFEATSTDILKGQFTYYGNRIRYCEVTATPFYANILPDTLPAGSFEPNAWVSNIQGFGGFIDIDSTERIITAAITQGSMILGMESDQRKMVNTGIETDPFSLQLINPDYGSAGTHSIIPMDKGILTAGEYGFIIASSFDAQRFDLPIIQQIFQVNPSANGYERISGGRDFVNEVVYFSYPSIFDPVDASGSIFPDTTLVFNYREQSFALWYESVSTYGLVKNQQKTWSALTDFTWENWNTPWNSPATVSTYPFVGFGTPQGFVMLKWANESTNDSSIMIQNISTLNPDGTYSITSVNHNLFSGAYVGFLPPGAATPSFIGYVAHLGDGNSANPDSIFSVNFDSSATPGSIVPGTWEVSIVDQPFIQTKQFPAAWSDARKTRVGAQKYFLDTTEFGEFTVNILGSQSPLPLNNSTTANPLPSLISNAIVRTRPDDSLGLNDNAIAQQQIWHRLASSCIGDTIQLQITFDDTQMRKVNIATAPWVLHTIILDLYPSRTLA